jgi:hypothetical protein
MAEYSCHKCQGNLDEDDTAWADAQGQVQEEAGNNYPYCVPCLPSQITARALARRAREQRNATTNNADFDFWHEIMVMYENKLKTGDRQ